MKKGFFSVNDIINITILISLAVIFRLLYLPGKNVALFCDAGLYANEAQKFIYGTGNLLHFPCRPLLHLVYLTIWFIIFGITEMTARLATLVMGILIIIPIYGMSKLTLRKPWYLLPPLLQAILWYPVAYSVVPVVDSTLALFVCCAIFCFSLYIESDSKKYLVLSGMFTGLALDTKETALCLLFIIGIFFFIDKQFFMNPLVYIRKELLSKMRSFIIPLVIFNLPEILRQIIYPYYMKSIEGSSGGIIGNTLFKMFPVFLLQIIPDIFKRVMNMPLFILLCSGYLILFINILRRKVKIYQPIILIGTCAFFLSFLLSAGRIYRHGHWLVYAAPFYMIIIGYFFSELTAYLEKYNLYSKTISLLIVIVFIVAFIIPETLARKPYFPYHSYSHMDNCEHEFKARVYNKDLASVGKFIADKQAIRSESGEIINIIPATVVIEDDWSYRMYSVFKLKSGKVVEFTKVFLPRLFKEYESFENLENTFKDTDIYYVYFTKHTPHIKANMKYYEEFIKREDIYRFDHYKFGESKVKIYFKERCQTLTN